MLGLALLLLGCEPLASGDCTQEDCEDGLTVTFTREAFPAARYGVVLDLSGAFIHCEATLPDEAATDGCADPRVTLERDESALLGFFFAEPMLDALAVTVTQDGAEIGYAAFDPHWEEWRPNGEDCEPVCAVAEWEIALDPP